MGLDLIEWTFDPLQALNAHLNFRRLGVIVREYEVNIYGESSSPLHRGSPTDRFVAEWWLSSPHVARSIADGRAEEERSTGCRRSERHTPMGRLEIVRIVQPRAPRARHHR